MEKINNELRKLCASLEGRVAARLDGEYEEYRRLLKRREEVAPGAGIASSRLGAQLALRRSPFKNEIKLRQAQAKYADKGNEFREVQAELARLQLLVYNARLVELNLLRQQIVDASLPVADEWMKLSGMVTDKEHARHRGPVEVDVHSLAELEALQLSPYIRQTVTLEALQRIIRFYRQVDAGHIVVRIHDVRADKPGITWRWPADKAEEQ